MTAASEIVGATVKANPMARRREISISKLCAELIERSMKLAIICVKSFGNWEDHAERECFSLELSNPPTPLKPLNRAGHSPPNQL